MAYLYNLFLVPLYYLLIKTNSKNHICSSRLFYIVVGIHAFLFKALANPYNYVE